MKSFYTILFVLYSLATFAQSEIKEITWDDLSITKFKAAEVINGFEYQAPIFTKDQKELIGKEIIISGNYHVLNNFGSKSYMLSRDEIIKSPMKGDEVLRLMMDGDPKIYFGKTIKIKGVLNVEESKEAETIYYITNVEPFKEVVESDDKEEKILKEVYIKKND